MRSLLLGKQKKNKKWLLLERRWAKTNGTESTVRHIYNIELLIRKQSWWHTTMWCELKLKEHLWQIYPAIKPQIMKQQKVYSVFRIQANLDDAKILSKKIGFSVWFATRDFGLIIYHIKSTLWILAWFSAMDNQFHLWTVMPWHLR